ncbi:MAG: sterol carrier family protein [Bowdeniella nasicola]|nr:sterol carrier family protein [Bowdeniella nasicola]
MAKRIEASRGLAALTAYERAGRDIARADLLCAVRFSLQEFAERHPGRAVEVRVPPAAAVQVFAGTTHTRGTPPNVVETDPHTWLALATGRETWADACARGAVQWSGTRANLAAALPYLPSSKDSQ